MYIFLSNAKTCGKKEGKTLNTGRNMTKFPWYERFMRCGWVGGWWHSDMEDFVINTQTVKKFITE